MYNYDVTYYDKQIHQISGSLYGRTISESKSSIINNTFRLEFCPTFKIYNTKLVFGILNLDYVKPKQKTIESNRTEYNFIPKYNSYVDSITVEKSSGNFTPPLNLHGKLHVAWSIGIEQEVPIKKYRYLIGVKGVYAYSVFTFITYLGIRISKPYTWKK